MYTLPLELQFKLARKLLGMARNEFSNHGCNDFDLVGEGGLTVEEAALVQQLTAEVGEEPREGTLTMDWLLMGYLSRTLGDTPKNDPSP